ncbi:hypothetical protein, partial [Mesorhizobium sp. M7A.F.Ca.CA.003.01.2.1]|uniref:hypothetical protein n=1 Tax=Mesorhizobium sp. M7A.F.Ca.CA.003.01.2.1 TaxID=2496722 RepID=UPI0019D14254
LRRDHGANEKRAGAPARFSFAPWSLRSDSTAADPIRHAEVNSGPAGLCETSFQACGFSVDKLFTTQDIEVNKTGKFRHR